MSTSFEVVRNTALSNPKSLVRSRKCFGFRGLTPNRLKPTKVLRNDFIGLTKAHVNAGETKQGSGSGKSSGPTRRRVLECAAMANWFSNFMPSPSQAGGAPPSDPGSVGPTNEVVSVVDGVRRKRMGGGDIFVSELGLGTQRWGSTDSNAPDEGLCHSFLDRAVLGSGVNLVDTAEQYPIPSDRTNPEGRTEQIIGSWMAKEAGRREKLVIASKITGGSNVSGGNIRRDLEGSLRRLGTDYLDLYLLHWPARYTPQANWGQSLMYNYAAESSPYYQSAASFEEIAQAMGKLVEEGKIRGWGMCNDNAFGLTASCYAARALGVQGPVVMQNDFSLIDRRAEENGVSEASSPIHENVGFMGYNALAGGMLTGKYLDIPAAFDDDDIERARKNNRNPRGRMDGSWGRTLGRYRSGPARVAIAEYAELAREAGLSLTDMSLRWCRERRGLTTALVAQTSMEQLEEDLAAFQNTERLPRDLMLEIDRIHMINRLPIFSSVDVPRDFNGRGEIGESIP